MTIFIYALTALGSIFGLGVCIWSYLDTERVIREEQAAEEAND
ncbi:hypothetical protein SAMN05216319_4836 [Duganella sp. CF402]|nr:MULTISPECIES: hypothetical protein [unclassified Duganella]RZT05867.1 hypothetical protein EV582_4187 [Duganella sp. BK701]SEM81703.1 hypothetical protein SAMN05216319_4836 [Duganella sp. CF402]